MKIIYNVEDHPSSRSVKNSFIWFGVWKVFFNIVLVHVYGFKCNKYCLSFKVAYLHFFSYSENANLQRILHSIRNERSPGSGSDTSVRQRRKQDMFSMRKAVIPTKMRGEFQMHPEWPPSIPHHYFP